MNQHNHYDVIVCGALRVFHLLMNGTQITNMEN